MNKHIFRQMILLACAMLLIQTMKKLQLLKQIKTNECFILTLGPNTFTQVTALSLSCVSSQGTWVWFSQIKFWLLQNSLCSTVINVNVLIVERVFNEEYTSI